MSSSKKRFCLLAGLMVPGLTAPALAGDYYLTARYVSDAANIGEIALFVDPNTIGTNENNRKTGSVTSINAAGVVASVYRVEVDCTAHTWRITYQTDYRADKLLAPYEQPSPAAPFAAIDNDAPVRKSLDFICAGSQAAAGSEKIAAPDAATLSRQYAPKLTFTHRPEGG